MFVQATAPHVGDSSLFKKIAQRLTRQDFGVRAFDQRAEVDSVAFLPHLNLQCVAGVDWLGEPDLDGLEQRRVVVGVLTDDGTDRHTECSQAMQNWFAITK